MVGMSLPSSGLGTTDCRAGESEGGAGFGALKLGKGWVSDGLWSLEVKSERILKVMESDSQTMPNHSDSEKLDRFFSLMDSQMI